MLTVIDLHFLGLDRNIAAFLIATDDGPILVETGPHSTIEYLVEGLANASYAAQDVRHVFLTHIHLDHAGAAWWFAEHGATIYVHPTGLDHLADPSRLMASARRIYQDSMDSLWGDMRPIPLTQLRAVADGESFTIGGHTLQAWHTPGHAVHHVAWQWNDSLFAGDVAGVRIGDGPVVPPCPPPDIDLEAWHASLRRMQALPVETLYLTHFGQINDKLLHLSALGDRLDRYAAWIRPYYERQATVEETTPAFTDMARQDLLNNGVSEDLLPRYEAANPAWMSVAGLLRYWRKRG